MALNIKNEETSRAVARLASLTGLSLTEAIKQAVDEKIGRIENADDRIEHILAIGRDCAARLPEALKTREHGDILFGADGLPS